MRRGLAILTGASVALLGAEILGEYDFKGLTAIVSGVIFGLVVAEVVVSVSKESGAAAAALAAALTAAGLLWVIWKTTGQGHDRATPVPVEAWIAVLLGAAVAAVLSVTRKRRRTAAGNRPEP